MTRTIQRQDSAQDSVPFQSVDALDTSKIISSSFHPTADSASDNDTSERPVREKLKKTSIASMPKNDLVDQRTDDEAGNKNTTISPHLENHSSTNKESTDTYAGSRGRPLRKRSFDDLEIAEGGVVEVNEQLAKKSSGHARKRSRDVRAGEGFEGENRRRRAAEIPVQEVDEHGLSDEGFVELDERRPSQTSGNVTRSMDQDVADQDMRDSTLSPRKKRSRDQLDADPHREQKIPATDEAKARRSSEEIDRDLVSVSKNSNKTATSAEHVEADGKPARRGVSIIADKEAVALNNLSEGPFGDPSTTSPFASLANSGPLEPGPHLSPVIVDQSSQASKSAFGASGFASSLSPFGTLGASSNTATTGKSSGSVILREKSSDSESGEASTKDITQAHSGISRGPALSSSLGFSSMAGVSAFAAPAVSTPNKFTGARFGTGFGNAFGGGAKLSSFAAPIGDAKLGGEGGTSRVFGAPAKDEEEEQEDKSESEEEGAGESAKENESGEVNDGFQQHDIATGEDGEEAIFSSPRVNLYSWSGTEWKEGGRGTFKLNVPIANPDDARSLQKTGRFIMRAHQTYRVLLNTPIFKNMKFGDSRGNEPTGKKLSFSVIEDGKPTPYLIKLNDDGEAKTLYREVRKLQQAL